MATVIIFFIELPKALHEWVVVLIIRANLKRVRPSPTQERFEVHRVVVLDAVMDEVSVKEIPDQTVNGGPQSGGGELRYVLVEQVVVFLCQRTSPKRMLVP